MKSTALLRKALGDAASYRNGTAGLRTTCAGRHAPLACRVQIAVYDGERRWPEVTLDLTRGGEARAGA